MPTENEDAGPSDDGISSSVPSSSLADTASSDMKIAKVNSARSSQLRFGKTIKAAIEMIAEWKGESHKLIGNNIIDTLIENSAQQAAHSRNSLKRAVVSGESIGTGDRGRLRVSEKREYVATKDAEPSEMKSGEKLVKETKTSFTTNTKSSKIPKVEKKSMSSEKIIGMKYPGGKTEHFRHLLFYAYHQRQTAAEAVREISNIYGKGVLGESTARKWFAKFKKGDFDLDDTPRSGRPVEFDEEELRLVLEEDCRQTSRELAEKMNCDHKTILLHLRTMGFESKNGEWIPRERNEINE